MNRHGHRAWTLNDCECVGKHRRSVQCGVWSVQCACACAVCVCARVTLYACGGACARRAAQGFVRFGGSVLSAEWMGLDFDFACVGKALGGGIATLLHSTASRLRRCAVRRQYAVHFPASFSEGLARHLAVYTPARVREIAVVGAALRAHLRAMTVPGCAHEHVAGLGLYVETNVPLTAAHGLVMRDGRLFLPLDTFRLEDVHLLARQGTRCRRGGCV